MSYAWPGWAAPSVLAKFKAPRGTGQLDTKIRGPRRWPDSRARGLGGSHSRSHVTVPLQDTPCSLLCPHMSGLPAHWVLRGDSQLIYYLRAKLCSSQQPSDGHGPPQERPSEKTH